jgi:tetratricopeptide (TPR) repeat protein
MVLRLLLVAVLGCASARAADAPVSPEAKRHVDVGVEQYNAGRYEEAVKSFELAYRLSGRPALLFNIARAEAKLGHEEAAIAFLRRYLEERPNAPDAPAVLAEIEAHEKAIAADKMRVQLEKDAARAAELAARHEAEAKDAQRRADEATAAARRAQDERQKKDQYDTRMIPLRRAGIALVAAGALVVVTGVALGIVASLTSDQVQSSSGDFRSCCADLESRGKITSGVGIAFDVIGGAAAVAGIGLLVWSARQPQHKGARLWLQPQAGGLAVGGRF